MGIHCPRFVIIPLKKMTTVVNHGPISRDALQNKKILHVCLVHFPIGLMLERRSVLIHPSMHSFYMCMFAFVEDAVCGQERDESEPVFIKILHPRTGNIIIPSLIVLKIAPSVWSPGQTLEITAANLHCQRS